jgi:hypothetical protein
MSESYPNFKNNLPLEKIYHHTTEFYDELCDRIKQPFWENKVIVVDNLCKILLLLREYTPFSDEEFDTCLEKLEIYNEAFPIENLNLTRQLFNESGFVDEIINFRKTFKLIINNPYISPRDKEKLYKDTVAFVNRVVEAS